MLVQETFSHFFKSYGDNSTLTDERTHLTDHATL